MKKKSKTGVLTLPDFKTYHKAIEIKTVLYWHKDRHNNNGIENPEIDHCIYSQLIFDKDAKTIQWGKKSFQQMVLGKLDIHVQKNEVGSLTNTIYKN